MALIKIQHSHTNLIFAACVANQTGATFEEAGNWIIVEDSPELVVPHYCLVEAVGWDNPERLGDAWRSLLLNKSGYLRQFDDMEIVISDDPPSEKRPAYLLRFDTEAQKETAEEFAERLGYGSLRDYLLAAIEAFNRQWEAQVVEPE